jgi:hypothetical protein
VLGAAAGSEILIPLLRPLLLSISFKIFKHKSFYGTILAIHSFGINSDVAMLRSIQRNFIINDMPNWIQFLTPDLLRKCAAILGLAGIVGFWLCIGGHVCMVGHLCHGEDGNFGFYFDAIWFTASLLSMACSVKSNLWLKPLFFCSFTTILIWWIVQIFRDRQIDFDYLASLVVLIVLVLCIRGFKWPTKNKNESHQNENVIITFISVIAYVIIACMVFGFALATKHGIENPLRQWP